MKTLKSFLEEAMTTPYENFYAGVEKGKYGDTHRYHFYDHKNRPFAVQIYNRTEGMTKGKAEVSFEDEHGSIGTTGQSGKHAMRIFSTVKDIMKKHADTHKDIDHYVFSAFKNEKDPENKVDSKAKLYSTIAKAHGGAKTAETDFFHNYKVPIKR